MHISVKWFGESFNVNLHSKAGAEEFLSVKGCRIKDHDGKQFLAFPSSKNEKTGKWWNHAWGNEAFQSEVIRIAKATKGEAKSARDVSDIEDDIPF
jgi:hypothetical protein